MVVLAEDFSGWSSARKVVTVPPSPPPPPPPTGPTADFSYSCTWLVCTFTDVSTAGSSAITSWSWTFGDGTPAASGSSVQHTFGAAGAFPVTLTVTDANSLSDGESRSVTVQAAPPPPVIALTVAAYKVRGRQTADLTWSGATTAQVAVLRDGVRVALRPNSLSGNNSWTHATNQTGGGSYTYMVCEADGGGNPTSVCSPGVVARF
jgi:PKD repeat protein